MAANGEPDILFMDIQLAGNDGVSVSANLLSPGTRTQLIFVTGYVEHCVRVYEVPHIYFLTKPVEENILWKALMTAEKKLDQLDQGMIVVKSGDAVERIRTCDIIYMESERRVVKIHTKTDVISVYVRLADLTERCGVDFIHCHQSYCVNRRYIQKILPNHFALYDGLHIPISQRRYTPAKVKFLDYLATQAIYKGVT